MNFYSSDEYLDALAAVWFPGRRAEVGIHVVEGRLFRLLRVEGLGPIATDGPRPDSNGFLDFLEPLASAPPGGPFPAARWIPRAALGTDPVTSSAPAAPEDGSVPAPFVDWSRFPAWPAFEAHVASRRTRLAMDARRKRRRLEERYGPLRFVWDDRRPALLDTALAWKSAQYVRTGVRDAFAVPRHVAMFRELWRRGLLVVATLSAGERLLAVHLGVAWQRRFSSWIPAYDHELTVLSPGRLLLDELLAESHRRGDLEFDFLLGDEPYKYHYATHQRRVGPLGTAPLPTALRRAARASVKRVLARYPALLQRARALEHQLTRPPGAGTGGPT